MNKKVLTLCAGVLLVSGSAVFTVNALNAGNESAQTVVVPQTKATESGVKGYALKTAQGLDLSTAKNRAWQLTSEKKLKVKDTEWYLGTNGQIVNDATKALVLNAVSNEDDSSNDGVLYIGEEGSEQYLHIAANGNISLVKDIDKANARLHNGTKLLESSDLSTAAAVALVVVEDRVMDLSAEDEDAEQVVVALTYSAEADMVEKTDNNKAVFKVEKGESDAIYLYTTKNNVKLYLNSGDDGIELTTTKPENGITVSNPNSDNSLKLGETELKVNNTNKIYAYTTDNDFKGSSSTLSENSQYYLKASTVETCVAVKDKVEAGTNSAISDMKADGKSILTYADGKLYMNGYTGDFYLTYSVTDGISWSQDAEKAATVAKAGNGLQITSGSNAYYLNLNDENSLTVSEDAAAANVALYAVDAEDGVSEEVASSLTANGKYILAEVKTEKAYVGTAIQATAITSIQSSWASEYGEADMTGLAVDADGHITATEAGVDDIVPPTYIQIDGQYLVEKNGGIALADPNKDGSAPAGAITWVLDGGNYYDLSYYKNNDGKKRYLVVNADGYSFTTDDKKATDISYNAGNTGSAFTGAVMLPLSPVTYPAPGFDGNDDGALVVCETPLLGAPSNDYVYLGGTAENGTFYYLTENGALTTDIENAGLFKVTSGVKDDKGRLKYTFTGRENESNLRIGGTVSFASWEYSNGFKLTGTDGVNGAVVLNTSTGTAELSTTATATTLGMYRSRIEQFTAEWLVHRYGSSFKLNFENDARWKNRPNKEWHGNVFADADLVPVLYDGRFWWNWDELTEVLPAGDWRANATQFLLKDKNSGFYIVLNTNGKKYGNTGDFVQGGYPFELLNEEDVKKVLDGTMTGYEPFFRINYLEGTTEYDTNQINGDAVKDNTGVFCIEVGSFNDFHYDLVVMATDNEGTVNNPTSSAKMDLFVTVEDRCSHDDRKPAVSFYTDDENIVRGEDQKNNPLLDRYVNITFKAADGMQFENEEGDMVNLDGKVLGVYHDGSRLEPTPTEPEYFLFDKAEGQWYVTMTDAAGLTKENVNGIANDDNFDSRKFTFINRENGATFSVKSMHALKEKDTYAVEYADNTPFGKYIVKTPWGERDLNQANRDTLVITKAEDLVQKANAKYMDSYANWTKEDLQDRTFQLSIDAAAQLYVTENEGKDSHFLGLTAEQTEVTNWRLVPMTVARVHDTDSKKYLTLGTDSVYTMTHPQYYSGGKFYAYNDTTAIIAYALQNIQNNEWLTYDPSQNQTIKSMICDPNSKNFSTSADLGEAYRFVLKEKAEGAQKIESGKYNIIGVDAWEYGDNGKSKYVDGGAAGAYYTLDLSKKLYGAVTYQKDNAGAIEVKKAYEDPTSVDIFTIAMTNSAEYVKMAGPRDTVRIYGNEENDFLLFEKGQFLNLGNTGDIAPAMVLDTAYINRPGNNRYQYLIVVNPDYIEPVYDQLNGGDYHLVEPDTMKGRFLVNQIDSAVIDARYHNNKFINDIEADEKELKLGFQWGYRTGDKLHLTDGQNGPDVEIIDLGTADFNKAKFAFKYVNEAAGEDFKIQTAWYDYDSAVKAGLDNKADWTWNNEGYLRSVNGVVVVTNGYTHGEEFLMAPEFSDPTANETIAAEGAISVVATDGAVIIKGAEGKNVVIATILGKVVANETVNSDNETIAVPAGIAVVSVDGESFKVVVK